MATYRRIQAWVQDQYRWQPKTCWIAHCKELAGLDRRDAPNRRGRDRCNPCPQKKRDAIFKAFRHFTMLIVLVVVGTLAVVGRVQAQQATASLERVEAGDVDAPNECGAETCQESRRVCLNGGSFVLAVKSTRTTPHLIVSAAVTTEQSKDVVEDEDPKKMPGWKFLGLYPGDAIVGQALGPGDNGWGWTTFTVKEPQCYHVTAIDSQARLYKLRLGVAW